MALIPQASVSASRSERLLSTITEAHVGTSSRHLAKLWVIATSVAAAAIFASSALIHVALAQMPSPVPSGATGISR